MRFTAWVLFLLALPAVGQPLTVWDQHFTKGESLEREGRHTAAQQEFEVAFGIAEQRGPDDWRLPLTLHNLGTVARELGHYAASERYYQRAISIWETHHPRRPTELAITLQNLGALNMVWGRLARAELYYRRAYALRLQALGPAHPHVGASLHGLAELAAARRRNAEAEDLYRQAAAVLETAYGENSLRVADVWHNWGALYSDMHRDAEAHALLERAAAVYERTVPDHPKLAVILRNLAHLDLRSGDLPHAGERLERSLRICENSLPPDHEQTAIILGDYGRYLYQAKRKKEAKLATERSRAILARQARENGAAYTVDAAAFLEAR